MHCCTMRDLLKRLPSTHVASVALVVKRVSKSRLQRVNAFPEREADHLAFARQCAGKRSLLNRVPRASRLIRDVRASRVFAAQIRGDTRSYTSRYPANRSLTCIHAAIFIVAGRCSQPCLCCASPRPARRGYGIQMLDKTAAKRARYAPTACVTRTEATHHGNPRAIALHCFANNNHLLFSANF